MQTRRIGGPYTVYNGLIFVGARGEVWREVNLTDLVGGTEVFELKVAGLEFQPDITLLAKRVPLQTPRIVEGKVWHGPTNGGDMLLQTQLGDFTGTTRQRYVIPEIVYVVPVTMGVPWNNQRER